MNDDLDELRAGIKACEEQAAALAAEAVQVSRRASELRHELARKEAAAKTYGKRVAEEIIGNTYMGCGQFRFQRSPTSPGPYYFVKPVKDMVGNDTPTIEDVRGIVADAIDAGRRDAFEQAAKQCELYAEGDPLSEGKHCAGRIRNLKASAAR
jgi:hypothetical protein